MLPQHAPAPQSPRRLGVGIDTSRYGHYAVFLTDDLQPAADELAFAESAAGFALLHQRRQAMRQRYGAVHFAVRLDVAGPYADNLLHFLHQRTTPAGDHSDPAALLSLTISCGERPRWRWWYTSSAGHPERQRDYLRSTKLRNLRQSRSRSSSVC
jgi:hypothetical protein